MLTVCSEPHRMHLYHLLQTLECSHSVFPTTQGHDTFQSIQPAKGSQAMQRCDTIPRLLPMVRPGPEIEER